MSGLDWINSAFVWLAVVMACVDLRTLSRDKRLRGMHLGTACLFTVWPMWDLVYYSGLRQWASFMACSMLACARAFWLVLCWRYRARPGKSEHTQDRQVVGRARLFGRPRKHLRLL